jgi:hypothetical protein
MAKNINQPLGNGNENRAQKEKRTSSPKIHFKTLSRYGKFISGIGWVLVAIGIIGILLSIALMGENNFYLAPQIGFGIIVCSLLLGISGISLVVFGQTVSCFVAIENNTRATYDAINSQADMVHPKETIEKDDGKDDDTSKDNLFK